MPQIIPPEAARDYGRWTSQWLHVAKQRKYLAYLIVCHRTVLSFVLSKQDTGFVTSWTFHLSFPTYFRYSYQFKWK